MITVLLTLAGCAESDSQVGSQPAEDDVATATIDKQIAAAAKGLRYESGDADYPLSLVIADRTDRDTIDDAFVRKAFAAVVDKEPDADKPLASLKAETRTFASWRAQFDAASADCDRNCRGIDNLNTLLAKSLTDIRVIYFGSEGSPGRVEGTTVSIFVVGKTSIKVKDAAGRTVQRPKLVGIRTLVVWT